MKQSTPILAFGCCCLLHHVVDAFSPTAPLQSKGVRRQSTATQINLWLDPSSVLPHTLSHASTFISTIDSDIASIPDNEFKKVFAGGGLIMLGSVLSTIFVGFLVEKGGGYADLVAETYAEQDFDNDKESFMNSLGLTEDQKKETEEMVRAFREKKMKKAGTWTEEDDLKKQQFMEEQRMFGDYD
jgi:hypothetical protein